MGNQTVDGPCHWLPCGERNTMEEANGMNCLVTNIPPKFFFCV